MPMPKAPQQTTSSPVPAVFKNAGHYFTTTYHEMKTLFFLFKKEKVFRYFLIIVVLMVVSGFIFMWLEYDRVLAANPNVRHISFIDKTVTVWYWAIVTIATCGYGDITPGTTAGRIMVIVVLFISVAAVSMFTANLASALTTKKMMERRGVMDLSGYSEHFVICGWKQAMDMMLDEIKRNNARLNLKKVIIIANIEPDLIEVFQQQFPAYQEINILRGEYYNEALLRKANIMEASEVFILADESVPGASRTEVDSKTVMTAMTIRTISRDVRICAELLDAKFERYLNTAHVDDIIYTNEYSKVLIANSFSRIGVSKVVNDLLNTDTPAFITTERIPDSFVGKKFVDLHEQIGRAHV
jgi:voltage-gated potassium channel